MEKEISVARRRKEREKKMRRLHILDCAESIMIKKGLNGLSMDAVAKEAEVAKGTLYLYFKSKEDIIAHLTLQAREALLQEFHEQAASGENPLEQIRAICMANYTFYKKNKLYTDLVAFYEVNRDLEDTPEIQQSSVAIMKFIVSIIDKARETGYIKTNIDSSELAMTMWGMCVGLIQLIDVKKDMIKEWLHLDQKTFFENSIRTMIDGIRA